MTKLRTMYMQRTEGDYSAAAVAFAFDLMQDDPATFKAGYSVENAVIAASEIFPAMTRLEIEEALALKIGTP